MRLEKIATSSTIRPAGVLGGGSGRAAETIELDRIARQAGTGTPVPPAAGTAPGRRTGPQDATDPAAPGTFVACRDAARVRWALREDDTLTDIALPSQDT